MVWTMGKSRKGSNIPKYSDMHTFSVVVEFPPSCLPAEKELIALSDNDFIIIIWANQQ